ncbi:hypothetical protein T05_2697 [Trichinella murrelli]|uniref:Uncharacterized protein n=1 Tax=Trichinella murrelli TaxID=144512 RepID=A0A0V0SXI8_9BILA|nr:hypothetical protein T05_2697 [Trichinella murrelli]
MNNGAFNTEEKKIKEDILKTMGSFAESEMVDHFKGQFLSIVSF